MFFCGNNELQSGRKERHLTKEMEGNSSGF